MDNCFNAMSVPSTRSFHWQSLAPLAVGRVYCSPVESGGQLYLIGGCDESGSPMNICEVYSPEADQWTTLPPMPTVRAGVAVAPLGKRILVIGGMGVQRSPLSTVEMYNVEEGKWEKRNSLCEAAMGVSVIVKGGRQAKNPVTAFEVFDTEARSWAKFPSIPCRRSFSSYVMTEESFLALGGLQQARGYRKPKFVRTVEVFDIEQGTKLGYHNPGTSTAIFPTEKGSWIKTTRRLNMKTKRADFVAAYLQGRVIVAGGLGDQPAVLSSAEALNPVKNRWEKLPPLPTARCTCSSIVFKNHLFVIGGVSQGPSSAVEALSLTDS
ncbi:kelch domain-containing protein 8A-like isoform X3 [Mobula hypostoma]|uniref:kelch domain-containing protein 8A-like isoform X3 n=1 Tax=Mobula hypostoma TaxID=723540 RepID=UPI002FC296D5